MSYVAFDWRKSVDFSSQMILVICSKSYQQSHNDELLIISIQHEENIESRIRKEKFW